MAGAIIAPAERQLFYPNPDGGGRSGRSTCHQGFCVCQDRCKLSPWQNLLVSCPHLEYLWRFLLAIFGHSNSPPQTIKQRKWAFKNVRRRRREIAMLLGSLLNICLVTILRFVRPFELSLPFCWCGVGDPIKARECYFRVNWFFLCKTLMWKLPRTW